MAINMEMPMKKGLTKPFSNGNVVTEMIEEISCTWATVPPHIRAVHISLTPSLNPNGMGKASESGSFGDLES
jgi:hypothetical protein